MKSMSSNSSGVKDPAAAARGISQVKGLLGRYCGPLLVLTVAPLLRPRVC